MFHQWLSQENYPYKIWRALWVQKPEIKKLLCDLLLEENNERFINILNKFVENWNIKEYTDKLIKSNNFFKHRIEKVFNMNID